MTVLVLFSLINKLVLFLAITVVHIDCEKFKMTSHLSADMFVSMTEDTLSSPAASNHSSSEVRTSPTTVQTAPVKTDRQPAASSHICPLCPYVGQTADDVLKHICKAAPKKAGDKRYKCTYPNCSYQGRRKSALKTHIIYRHRPAEERPFPCPKCSLRCINRFYVEKHVDRVHRNIKPFH